MFESEPTLLNFQLEINDRVAALVEDENGVFKMMKCRVASTDADTGLIGVTFEKDGPVKFYNRSELLPLYRLVKTDEGDAMFPLCLALRN